MNEIMLFKSPEFGEIRSIQVDGEPWFVLKDVCEALELSNPTSVAQRLDEDERAKFNLGRQGEAIIINESGLYAVILRSDKPQAKPFRKWLTNEVVPSIRKTGSYSSHQTDSIFSEVQLLNARTMNSNVYLTLLEHIDTKSETYKPVLMAYAANTAAGQPILPLPKSDHGRTYSATEIGAIIGVTKKKIGDLASEFNLRTPQFGQFYHDVAHGREVDSFRYYENAIDEFRRANDTHDRNKADRDAEKKRLKAQERANRKAAK